MAIGLWEKVVERRSWSIAYRAAWVVPSLLMVLLAGCNQSRQAGDTGSPAKLGSPGGSASPAGPNLPAGNGQPVAVTPGEVAAVGDDSLSPLLKQAKQPVLLDTYATWCGPCKMMAPEVEKVAKELSGKLVVAKLDVDANPQVAKALSIESIPALFLFQDGRVVGKWEGYAAAGEIRSRLGSKVPELR